MAFGNFGRASSPVIRNLGATEASKTLRNIRSVYIKEFTAAVENDKISSYRVTANVTFEMERG